MDKKALPKASGDVIVSGFGGLGSLREVLGGVGCVGCVGCVACCSGCEVTTTSRAGVAAFVVASGSAGRVRCGGKPVGKVGSLKRNLFVLLF